MSGFIVKEMISGRAAACFSDWLIIPIIVRAILADGLFLSQIQSTDVVHHYLRVTTKNAEERLLCFIESLL